VNRTPIVTGSLVAAALFATSCGGGDDTATETTQAAETTVVTTTVPATTTTTVATTTTVPVVTTTTIPDVLRMPLTGVPIESRSEIPDRPALVVKISNYPQSVVPQAGLNQADIVFAEVINDNATRFAAVFHTQEADPVGPIRSGRAQDVNLLLSLNRPLFAWSGGNPAVTRAVQQSDLIDLSALHSSGYYRRSGRSDANTLFSATDVLWAQAPDDAEPPKGPIFPYLREGESPGTDPATVIDVVLDGTKAHWEYDEDTERYYRWQNGDEHDTESNGGTEQVWVDNVVVLMADYGRNQFDGNPDAQTFGSNPVYVFTRGTVRSGIWLRFGPEDPFGFFGSVEELDPIGLSPGRTWVEIPRNRPDLIGWS
jgi:hypothetical protein